MRLIQISAGLYAGQREINPPCGAVGDSAGAGSALGPPARTCRAGGGHGGTPPVGGGASAENGAEMVSISCVGTAAGRKIKFYRAF